MSAPIHRCPLMDASLPLLFHTSEPDSGMRHLRRDLQACQDCSANPGNPASTANCPLRNAFSAQVQVAIQSVLEEYAWAG